MTLQVLTAGAWAGDIERVNHASPFTPAPAGSPPGTPGPDAGDTEAQATRALGKIKAALADKGLGFGDIVMMHAYLAPDPTTGRGDGAGWNRAYSKTFGTADQPNKPSRTSITVVLGGPTVKIEIETIAVRKPKMWAKPLYNSQI